MKFSGFKILIYGLIENQNKLFYTLAPVYNQLHTNHIIATDTKQPVIENYKRVRIVSQN